MREFTLQVRTLQAPHPRVQEAGRGCCSQPQAEGPGGHRQGILYAPQGCCTSCLACTNFSDPPRVAFYVVLV